MRVNLSDSVYRFLPGLPLLGGPEQMSSPGPNRCLCSPVGKTPGHNPPGFPNHIRRLYWEALQFWWISTQLLLQVFQKGKYCLPGWCLKIHKRDDQMSSPWHNYMFRAVCDKSELSAFRVFCQKVLNISLTVPPLNAFWHHLWIYIVVIVC